MIYSTSELPITYRINLNPMNNESIISNILTMETFLLNTNDYDVNLYVKNPAVSNQLFINVTSVVTVEVASFQLVANKALK